MSEDTSEEILTPAVTGKSVIEIANLLNIEKLARDSLKNHREIIEKNIDLEFEIEKESELELGSMVMAEIVTNSSWNPNSIKELVVSRVNDKAVLLIMRKSESDEQ